MHVPVLSIVFMAVSGLVCLALAVGLCLYFRKKGADILPYFVGFGVFLVFALILESIVHQLVLNSAIGEKIRNTVWLYALYGGLMAGLFEETGRLIAFLTVLKKQRGKDVNALMYGAGHGGFEAIMLVGLAMISNIALSILINAGFSGTITEGLTGDTLEQINSALETLAKTPSYTYLLSMAERISAVTLHISLSVFVWFAVKNRKWILYPAAIALHAAIDGILVIMQQGAGLATWLIEIILAASVAAVALLALLVWKSEHKEELPPEEAAEGAAETTIE